MLNGINSQTGNLILSGMLNDNHFMYGAAIDDRKYDDSDDESISDDGSVMGINGCAIFLNIPMEEIYALIMKMRILRLIWGRGSSGNVINGIPLGLMMIFQAYLK